MKRKKLTVLVLAGGDSAERDVSLESARGMAEAARESGHVVLAADPARPEIEPTDELDGIFTGAGIAAVPPDVKGAGSSRSSARRAFARMLADSERFGVDIVLNGLHGGIGEDGTVQALLDLLGIPYTGSGAAASALAMDKYRSKRLAEPAGVPVADGILVRREQAASVAALVRERLSLPVVVKPNNQGSSVGLTVVDALADLYPAAERAFQVSDDILIEAYVAGREITAAVLEGEQLPLLEIRPQSGLYDYFHKYQSGASEYLVPAPVEDAVAAAVAESARRAFDVLGCRVYGRADFRLGKDGRHCFLEVNTLPGMTSTSLVPKAARKAGIEYPELVDRILQLSLSK
jgi:D-alanine-D-alanine ligase